MKAQGAKTTRYIQDGLLILSSDTLHYQKRTVRGWLYKKAEQQKFFQTKDYYKRFFTLNSATTVVTIGEQPVTKILKKIAIRDIEYIEKLREHTGSNDCPQHKSGERWLYSFELKTKNRVYILYAANKEERDLWVDGFKRLHGVPVLDQSFTPLERITHSQVLENANVKEEKKVEKREVVSELASLRSIPSDDDQEESKEEKQLDAPALGLMNTNQTAQSSMRNSRIAKRRLGSARKLESPRIKEEIDDKLDEETERKFQVVTGVADGQVEKKEIDPMGTVNMISQLGPENKRILNSLVQSVLDTSQANDRDNLKLLTQKRQLLQA